MKRTPTRATKLAIEALEDRWLLSAGFLDPTFGGDGLVATNFKTPDSFDRAWDVAVYPGSSSADDGKVVAVGTTVTNILKNGTWDYDFALARYNPDGTLDATFGQGGKVATSLGTNTDVAYAVELVGSKILVAGATAGSGIAVARYNDNGSLDSTFGNNGKVLTKVGGGGAGYAMKVAASGKIIVAGVDGTGALAVARYTANGGLDPTFGKNGVATTTGLGIGFAGGLEVAITPASVGATDAGKIVVVGSGGLARFTTAGVLDVTFDNDGLLSIPPSSSMPSVAIQSDGRIVVSESVRGVHPDLEIQLLRVNLNGTLDTSFDGDGQVTVSRPGTQYTTSVAIQPDGKILVAGDEWPLFAGSQTTGNFFVARFTADGQPDPTYGNGGIGLSAENNLQWGGQPNVEMALQENGKVVACGWTYTVAPTGGYVSDFAVARFLSDDALHATAVAPKPTSETLSLTQAQPLLTEALTRWQAAGGDTASLTGLNIRIADLGGTTLGLASGNTIWLDDNAAGWGWFYPTPGDDSKFTTPGNQGEMHRIDLLTVLMHEIGHLLGHDHEADGVMAETLTAGTRSALNSNAAASRSAADMPFAFLTDERSTDLHADGH